MKLKACQHKDFINRTNLGVAALNLNQEWQFLDISSVTITLQIEPQTPFFTIWEFHRNTCDNPAEKNQ